jgi:hypothetical protein
MFRLSFSSCNRSAATFNAVVTWPDSTRAHTCSGQLTVDGISMACAGWMQFTFTRQGQYLVGQWSDGQREGDVWMTFFTSEQ